MQRKLRYDSDPKYRMICLIRSNLQRIRNLDNACSYELVGCNWTRLYTWLYMTLSRGYNMDEIGNMLQVDHIIPISLIELSNMHLASKCNNLQLLAAADNLAKSNKLSQHDIDIQRTSLDVTSKLELFNGVEEFEALVKLFIQ